MNEVSIVLKNYKKKNKSNRETTFETPITFTLGNIGFKILPISGLFKSCLSIFVEPIVISPNTGEWEGLQTQKEFLVPLETKDSLLIYAKNTFDHLQWGEGSVKVFWKNEGIEITLLNKGTAATDFILLTKKFVWDGISFLEGTSVRKVNYISGTTFQNSFDNGLDRENYEERITTFDTEENEYNKVVKGLYRKDIMNKILSKFGLQLKE